MTMDKLCNTCIHKIVCSKYIATGGVNNCEHHREERKQKTMATTMYRLTKGDEILFFQSEAMACRCIGVKQCTVASCFRRGEKVKGYAIEKIGLSTHGETKTRLHRIWRSMIDRCEYEKHPHFANYGGRGIKVCDEWKEYVRFRNWALISGYAENLTIDRKDNDGDYTPTNCRWSTVKEQQNNRRNNHTATLNGVSHTIAEWAEILGIKKTTIKERLKRGWSDEKALTTPVRKRSADMRGNENG
jgi:hypothetical protein